MIQGEKLRLSSDDDVLRELCAANGVCFEQLAEEGRYVLSLEIFFSGFPRMVGLSSFPYLCQLTVVGQSIRLLEGLDGCPLLQELWVVQCQLTEIRGLQNCPELKKLYLYDNQISAIKNLDAQISVEVLWLNNNRITHIEGLDSLQNLVELNLADNDIERIGNGLNATVSLQTLNLSGNNISSFKELTLLARLPRLRELALQDPTSSPNPVCLLCNYATHLLYHIPVLQRLDAYDVSCKQVKEAAESTVLKKMMYYNMRVRAARRGLTETRQALLEEKKIQSVLPAECIRTLSHALKDLERERQRTEEDRRDQAAAVAAVAAVGDQSREHKVLRKMEALKERLERWSSRLQEIEARCEEDLSRATATVDGNVRFLLMELESVGSIRLEEGCSSEPWFGSCSELLLSRFSLSDYETYGVSGVRISRVVRVHNSALRLRFEEKLQQTLHNGEESGFSQSPTRRLEHLFYVWDPDNSWEDELESVLKEGFPSAEEYKARGGEAAVPLSDSLLAADRPRMERSLRQSPRNPQATRPFAHGHVILSKAFVGRSALVGDPPVHRDNYPRAHAVYRCADTQQGDELSRSACGLGRRRWFVFDHQLVLPEYIIYFEYIAAEQTLLSCSTDGCSLDKEVLDMEPALTPQPRLSSLDADTILSVSGADVLHHVTVLNLHSSGLRTTKELSRLAALRRLTVSFNQLSCLDDVCHMPNLEFLDASFNRLETLDGLRGLGRLQELDVRWNELTDARQDAAALRKHTPALLKLDTRHNPWSRSDAVRSTILGRVTTLTLLDDVPVGGEEAAEAVQTAAGSRLDQATLLARSCPGDERPRSLSLLSTAQLLCRLAPSPWSPDLEPGWSAQVTALDLDDQSVSRLSGLRPLVNLRWASFNNNSISTLEGLDGCLKLEELFLNNNAINTLSGLRKLQRLSKVSLDGNQLSSLDACVLQQLPSLSYLSVENNSISSLSGVHRLHSLLELYVGNNHISTSRDIYHLKGLTSLIILDLYGNPLLQTTESYRKYVVFQLPSLKALDGVAVEATECESAKDLFGGRLTPDMVTEKLGLSNYMDLTFLHLPSCSVRTVDLSPPEMFRRLSSVNLDHNNLTSFSGLVYLPNISVLSLNYNHIESVLPRQRTHLTNKQMLHSKVHSSGYGQQSCSRASRDAGASGGLEPLMASLEVLYLSHNGISSMSNLQLSRLTGLKALFLQGNEMSQVEGLEGLQQLRVLALDRNRIKALANNSLVSQRSLQELNLAENRIRELNNLHPLGALRKLHLDDNKLQDVTELHKLDVLPSLTELSVLGNPVARNSAHRPSLLLHLPQLQVLDRLTITLEERTRAELLSAETSGPGSSLPVTEINLPALLPFMPRMPLRAAGGGPHPSDVPPTRTDDLQPQRPSKYNKHRHGQAARSCPTNGAFRLGRRAGTNAPATGLLPDDRRFQITFPNEEQHRRSPQSLRARWMFSDGSVPDSRFLQ